MATTARDKTPGQLFALVFGAVYVLIGILGFAVTGFDNFFNSSANEILIVFPVNPAHNIVHLLLGAIWLAGSRTVSGAKLANTGIGVAYLAFFVLGLVGALEWLSIESAINADQLLHLVSGGASLYFGTAGATARRPVTA
ncbi:MAG: DUF4383 domain-containing protein [Actinomycetota bacterium]|nr:DUF4383 domain-containing protein [Actinomycetota bacterium]